MSTTDGHVYVLCPYCGEALDVDDTGATVDYYADLPCPSCEEEAEQ